MKSPQTRAFFYFLFSRINFNTIIRIDKKLIPELAICQKYYYELKGPDYTNIDFHTFFNQRTALSIQQLQKMIISHILFP